MSLLRRPTAVAITALLLASVVSLGPHLALLGYQLAGARPPAALLFLCPLHHLVAAQPPSFAHARPFGAPS